MDYLDPRADGRCGSYQVDRIVAKRKANYADMAQKQSVLYAAGDAIRARRAKRRDADEQKRLLALKKERDEARYDPYARHDIDRTEATHLLPANTNLWVSCGTGDEALLRHALKQGARVTCRYPFGQTALHRAAWSNRPKMCKILIASGADVTARNAAGLSAADYAEQANHPNTLSLLRSMESGKFHLTLDANGEPHMAIRDF